MLTISTSKVHLSIQIHSSIDSEFLVWVSFLQFLSPITVNDCFYLPPLQQPPAPTLLTMVEGLGLRRLTKFTSLIAITTHLVQELGLQSNKRSMTKCLLCKYLFFSDHRWRCSRIKMFWILITLKFVMNMSRFVIIILTSYFGLTMICNFININQYLFSKKD